MNVSEFLFGKMKTYMESRKMWKSRKTETDVWEWWEFPKNPYCKLDRTEWADDNWHYRWSTFIVRCRNQSVLSNVSTGGFINGSARRQSCDA